MAKVRRKIGDKLYLWTDTVNTYATECVISAHGFYVPPVNTFMPPADVEWYCQHNQTQNTASIASFSRGQNSSGVSHNVNVENYSLYKYQEHSGDIKATAKSQNMSFKEAEKFMGGALMGGETYHTLRNLNRPSFDVVTIRWRGDDKSISFQDVLRKVHAKNPYAKYHALFCREQKLASFKPT